MMTQGFGTTVFHRLHLGEQSYCAKCRIPLKTVNDSQMRNKYECPRCGLVAKHMAVA